MSERHHEQSGQNGLLAKLWARKELAFLCAGLVIAAGAWLFPRRLEPTRSAQLEVLASAPLVSGLPRDSSDWQLHYKGQPVESPHQTVLRFTNTGEAPIVAQEVEVPLTVRWSEGEVVSHSILNAEPSTLRVTISAENSKLQVISGLLNPGNSFVVQFVTKSKPVDITYSFRSFGIDDATVLVSRPNTPPVETGRVFFELVPIGLFVALVSTWVCLFLVDVAGPAIRRRVFASRVSPRAWRAVRSKIVNEDLYFKLSMAVRHHFASYASVGKLQETSFKREAVLIAMRRDFGQLSDYDIERRLARLEAELPAVAKDALIEAVEYAQDAPRWWKSDVAWYLNRVQLPNLLDVGYEAYYEKALNELSKRFAPLSTKE
jgi:hypothetical protein